MSWNFFREFLELAPKVANTELSNSATFSICSLKTSTQKIKLTFFIKKIFYQRHFVQSPPWNKTCHSESLENKTLGRNFLAVQNLTKSRALSNAGKMLNCALDIVFANWLKLILIGFSAWRLVSYFAPHLSLKKAPSETNMH